MRVLVITQKIDKQDDLLGSFHHVIGAFAEQCDAVIALGLGVGEYDLPENTTVLSLGKESGNGRLTYVWRLFKYSWQYRSQYDAAFVHMNKEYVLIAGWFWRLLGKKVGLWYAHYLINWTVKLAVRVSHVVVTSTAFACNIVSPKLHVVGQGINTDVFAPDAQGASNNDVLRILFLGRISPIKHVEVLVDALAKARDNGCTLHCAIVGGPHPGDEVYEQQVKQQVITAGLENVVSFVGPVPNTKTNEWYQRSDVFVNLTQTGSFDKTTLEAMATECISVVSNQSFESIFPESLHADLIYAQNSAQELADRLVAIAQWSPEKRKAVGETLRSIIVHDHNVSRMVSNIIAVLK